MRYVSSHTEGSYEGSYFSISFGALKFAGFFSPWIIGPKHLGPSRLSDPIGSPSRRLVRMCRRSSGWRAPALVVDDVGAGVDGLTVGGDEVGRWPGVVGGERRVRESMLELQWFGWKAVEGVCRQWATT